MSRTISLIAIRDDGYRAEARLTRVPERPDIFDLALIESLGDLVRLAAIRSDGPAYDDELKSRASRAVEWSPSGITVEFGARRPGEEAR